MYDPNLALKTVIAAIIILCSVEILIISDFGFYTNMILNLIAKAAIIFSIAYIVYLALCINPPWVSRHE